LRRALPLGSVSPPITDRRQSLLCPTSIRRPWVNFEAGAAWMHKIPIIPLCHGGLEPRDLPMPLSSRQGLLLSKDSDLKKLYSRIAKELTCEMPERTFDQLSEHSFLGSPHVSRPRPKARRNLLATAA
jgi:hypothetical protein